MNYKWLVQSGAEKMNWPDLLLGPVCAACIFTCEEVSKRKKEFELEDLVRTVGHPIPYVLCGLKRPGLCFVT